MNAKSKKLFEAFLVGMRDEVSLSYLKKKNIRHKWLERLGMDDSCAKKRLHFTGGMQLSVDRKQIREIDKALRRIQSDSYNICESCGGIIPERQLSEMVLPWPTICDKCERIDSTGDKQPNSFSPKKRQDFPDVMMGKKTGGRNTAEVLYET